jgi:hypothetical protein
LPRPRRPPHSVFRFRDALSIANGAALVARLIRR